MIKIDLMDNDEVERFAAFNFNKVEAADRFVQLASNYKTLVLLRKRGREVSNPGAEEFATRIEAGITIEELEAWLET